MIERVEAIERRISCIEKRLVDDKHAFPPQKRVLAAEERKRGNARWIFVPESDVNADMIETILDMYVGRNFAGFKEHVFKQVPFSLHVLGYDGDVSTPQAVIILKKFSKNVTQIKLTVQRSKAYLGEVSKKYCEMLGGNGSELIFTELGAGPLEGSICAEISSKLKDCGFGQVSCPTTICAVAQVMPAQIITSETDVRRSVFASTDSLCPIYSYIVNANGGKRMAMYATNGFSQQMSKEA